LEVEGGRRLRVELTGAVQGVGFRPFVYRLAEELGLGGHVLNDGRGVVIEAEGRPGQLELFLARLPAELPPNAAVLATRTTWLEPVGFDDFSIAVSVTGGRPSAVILPELATCPDCLREIFDPADRRYRYPFTNCTHCGPRFSILRSLPYDRPNTTMQRFEMCDPCRREYEDPRDRRFHAQPNACPQCGPQLSLLDHTGRELARADAALRATAEALSSGGVVAVKGLGGFHLMVDAGRAAAVRELRERKHRYEKPLALMVRDLGQAHELCEITPEAAERLGSPEAPIVLLPRRPGARIAAEVAPGNPCLGVMLPYTPLHHLLLREVGAPVVATSGNLRDEPICIDNAEAVERLRHVADLFLVHDRPIVRPVDDSVVRTLQQGVQPVRRSRGCAPLPLSLGRELPPILALGAHLKNVIALSVGPNVFLSQHIGDMETPQAMAAFERAIEDFLELYAVRPEVVACDLHPDYASTRWLKRIRSEAAGLERGEGPLASIGGARVVGVQHHHAHLAACLADQDSSGRALGVTWDGTGYGPDGTIWGGEFLAGDAMGYRRMASLRPFRLPGGEAAVLEPRRVALSLLWALGGCEALDLRGAARLETTGAERRLFARMLDRNFRSPVTTSAGRLFDGVAALLGLHQRVAFEGQAAMALEFAADPTIDDAYPVELVEPDGAGAAPAAPPLQVDWASWVAAILEDLRRGVPTGTIAARFHGALAGAIVAVAERSGEPVVALTGGCFQNRLLTLRTREALERGGFEVLVHRRVPPNDGGISLGQVMVAAAAEASGQGTVSGGAAIAGSSE
jgi:hydrogenase maturation protein HypF